MGKKQNLDYLLIPRSSGKIKKQRNQRAAEEKEKRKIKRVLIMNGKDSEEDILLLGKKLKGKERIGIVTFPLHFREYLEIIKKAQKEGKFPKRVLVEGILTKQNAKEFVYGELGFEEEKIFEKKVDFEKDRKKIKFIELTKNVLKRVLNLSK